MAAYGIRVELLGYPTADQYQSLHTVMANFGFYRTVAGLDPQGNWRHYNLPHGMYYGESNFDVVTLRDQITNSVKIGVQPNVLIFVVQATTWAMGW